MLGADSELTASSEKFLGPRSKQFSFELEDRPVESYMLVMRSMNDLCVFEVCVLLYANLVPEP